MFVDDDLEASIRRYRVVDPPAALKASVIADASRSEAGHRPAWLWGPAAAAAVVVLWLGLQVATLDDADDPVRAAEVDLVARILGGGEGAEAYAEYVVPDPVVDRPATLVEQAWVTR